MYYEDCLQLELDLLDDFYEENIDVMVRIFDYFFKLYKDYDILKKTSLLDKKLNLEKSTKLLR